jgi:capsular polysaccharide biosynthesis protein
MTEQAVNHYEDDEISLLDILVTLAESWKLLVFCPLIAGVLAGALSFVLPKTYESQAMLRITEEEAALLHTAQVLDSLIIKFELLKDVGGVIDEARHDLRKRLVLTFDKKTKLVLLVAKGRDPTVAQDLASESIRLLLIELRAKGGERELIEEAIVINDRAISNAEDAIDAIQGSLKKGVMSDQALESAVKNLSAINSDISRRSMENATLKQKLNVRGTEVFAQEPSLPQQKTSPKPSLFVTVSYAVSLVFILIFIFARNAFRVMQKDTNSLRKISKIKCLLSSKYSNH